MTLFSRLMSACSILLLLGCQQGVDSTTVADGGSSFSSDCSEFFSGGNTEWAVEIDDGALPVVVIQPELAIDGDISTAATVILPALIDSNVRISVNAQEGVVFPSGVARVFRYGGTTRPGSFSISSETTYLNGEVQEVQDRRHSEVRELEAGNATNTYLSITVGSTQKPFDAQAYEFIARDIDAGQEVKVYDFCINHGE